MTKRINLLLALCLLNVALTYGRFRLKARERTLQQQLNTLSVARGDPAKAEKRLGDCIFPWKNNPRFSDTRMRFEEFFTKALQKNVVWDPEPTPSPLRNNVVRHTGHVTAFFFYPHLRPFLKALSEFDAPLWVRSMQIVRNGLSNACFKVALTVEIAERNEATSIDASILDE